MANPILSLEPQAVWRHFYAITQIPHPSKHEEQVRNYVVDFAKKNNINHTVDSAGNVILRKPATPGLESRKGIILQAHLDMVPQKNSDKTFDFEKDPLAPFIDGDWVKADGTTLGADNGIGVAAILAVMESTTLKHGPLEALLTLDEETGMAGAFGLKARELNGDILLNLDSEDEGELYVGCAGGLDANIEMRYTMEEFPAGYKSYDIFIKGLRGGHSGLEIILQRANANKLLVRFLKYADRRLGLRLVSIDGGGLRNAIPREAKATVLVPAMHEQEFLNDVKSYETTYKKEYEAVEDGINFTAAVSPEPTQVMDIASQRKLVNAVYACPNGVIRMSDSMPGLVETSINVGRVVSENGIVKIVCLLRSSVNSAKHDLGEMVSSVFEPTGADINLTGGYDGWNPNMDSPILKTMQATYQKLYGKIPEIKAIHAGLECGIIGGVYPNLDMISFGPTIRFPHSPDEKVLVPSVEKFWKFLATTLEDAPAK